MPGCLMPFPKDWHEFLKDYSFDDSQEVYTNGSRLIPVFRVEQLIEHLLKAQEPVAPVQQPDGEYICGACGNGVVGCDVFDEAGIESVKNDYCPTCGRRVKW